MSTDTINKKLDTMEWGVEKLKKNVGKALGTTNKRVIKATK